MSVIVGPWLVVWSDHDALNASLGAVLIEGNVVWSDLDALNLINGIHIVTIVNVIVLIDGSVGSLIIF